MLNRIASILVILLTTVLSAGATMMTGAWKNYPVAGEFTHIIDTGSRVWYVSGGRLNYYDPSSDETRSYEAGRDLSDFVITGLFHNPAGKYVVVAYDNANIDIVYEDEARGIVNVPDIRDSSISADKTINTMAFNGDNIYVGTNFGMVIIDEPKAEIKESGIYNGHGILDMCAIRGGLLISPTGYEENHYPLLFHSFGDRIHRYDGFKVVSPDAGHFLACMTPLGVVNGEDYVVGLRWGALRLLKMRPDRSGFSISDVYSGSASQLVPIADKGVAFVASDGNFVTADSTGKASAVRFNLPESLRGQLMATSAGPAKGFWLASADGLGQYRFKESDGSVEVLRDKSLPAEATTFSQVCRIYPTASGHGFIISNLGLNRDHPIGTGNRHDTPLMADVYADGVFEKIDPEVEATISFVKDYQRKQGKKIFSPTCIVEDPDFPGRYFITSANEGVYVVEGNKEIAHFTEQNSPIHNYWALTATWCTIDHQGNLWVSVAPFSTDYTSLVMLPAEKRRQADLSRITKSDWATTPVGKISRNAPSSVLVCRKSNIIIMMDWHPNTAFEVIQHNGNIADTGSYRHEAMTSIVDTDGKTLTVSKYCMVEDKKGVVWIGTSQGVLTIPNPNNMMSPSFAVNRVKVPRNDGTNLADYLLESEQITSIAVDNSNRKWIGTYSSGLYLVSENGDQILGHYTTANSSLPSDAICALYADPESNSLFIGTLAGLIEFSTDSSPAMDDYSEAYAYPNPLTPDYTGWVTITGLMGNSLVKIVDQNMHLVYQTTSEGGMATWDGCNMNGERVRSGVYYVMASSGSGDSGSSAGAVATKILVIN
ncbi:MAG: hypothetical protein K2H87_04870 [Duncaniella sp.]|nr:hypothetical protein [Duncaniella sp.]